MTLLQAMQVIQELRTTETDLKKKKSRLTKRRDDYLTTIVPGMNTESRPPEKFTDSRSSRKTIFIVLK